MKNHQIQIHTVYRTLIQLENLQFPYLLSVLSKVHKGMRYINAI